MRLEIVSFTDAGYQLNLRLKEALEAEGNETGSFNARKDKSISVDEWTENGFKNADALIFIGACGIAVRKIAPFVTSKLSDPAVIVIDEKGGFVISLLSGHAGGANELSIKIAGLIGAIPVVTTATDVNGRFAVDTWAVKQGLAIENPQNIKWVSGRLLAGETIKMKSDFPISGEPPRGIEVVENDEYDVLISYRTKGRKSALRLVPRCLSFGMGARKNIELEPVLEGFEAALKKGSINPLAVKSICTIDIKAEEKALIELCRIKKLPFRVFSAEQLNSVKGNFSGSDFVKSITGVDNVCERSAVLDSGGKLIVRKSSGNGVTAAIAMSEVKLQF